MISPNSPLLNGAKSFCICHNTVLTFLTERKMNENKLLRGNYIDTTKASKEIIQVESFLVNLSTMFT